MDKTNKLKKIILSRYSSLREFSKIVDIPSTTLTSSLDRGIGGMAVDRVIKICDVLNIDIKTFEPLDSTSTNLLTSKEDILLNSFNDLNDLGKDEAIKRVAELSEIPKYSNENIPTTLAAHNSSNDPEANKRDLEKLKEVINNKNK